MLSGRQGDSGVRTFFDTIVFRAMYRHFEEGRFGTASIEKGRREPWFVELKRDGVPWMNNMVGRDDVHLRWFNGYRGRVLIGGLGLGLDLFKMDYYGLLDSDRITSVDVVEIDGDVVGLVAPYHPHRKISIMVGDVAAFLQNATERYDNIVFDVFHDDSALEPTARQNLIAKTEGRLLIGGTVDFWH